MAGDSSRIVVVGGGQAGSSLCVALRTAGFAGSVTLIGEEPVAPYQRPPLSKKYLLGQMTQDRLLLRPERFYAEREIILRKGERITCIDRDAKWVILPNGNAVDYDLLALTTGSVARRLPSDIGGALDGIFTVRTLADVDTMASFFEPDGSVLIVGGGYIGLEAAAVAAQRGLHVVLVEAAERILQRVAAPETSDYFRALHVSHGVDLREGTGVVRLEGGDGWVEAAILTDGTRLPVDFVIAGIGIAPATQLAEEAGLEVGNGISVDELGRTSDPAIFAAGDCASFPYRGRRIRLESVPHAVEHGEAVAAAMLGGGQAYEAHPWFWSDQYDVKLQIAGLHDGYDRTVVRPTQRPDAQSVWYFNGRDLVAVDAMNDPRSYMAGRRWIEGGQSPDPADIANPLCELKAMNTVSTRAREDEHAH